MSIIKKIKHMYDLVSTIEETKMEIETNLLLSAKAVAKGYKGNRLKKLSEAEFKVFSQNGEDGIIQYLINNIEIENETFVEFGVGDYRESNTRFLLNNDNWSGLIIDGSEENMFGVHNWLELWKYNLKVKTAFIDKDNINDLISSEGIIGDIGLLSVDLDGNDYYVLDAIKCISPRIVICEYNSVFGGEHPVSIPYDPNFYRTKAHYSNLYWGTSLKALMHWADNKGYTFVGCNSFGNNAFFVRNDCVGNMGSLIDSAEFVEGKYRESRDREGNLSYVDRKKMREIIKDMDLYNVCTKEIKKVYELN